MRNFFVLLGVCVLSAAVHADDFSKLVKNYNSVYPAGKADFKAADTLLADMQSDGSFKSVKYDDKSRGMWLGMKHWRNLRELVAAWRKSKDGKYLEAINKGLVFWGKNLPSNSNWWWQEIGVPIQMIRVINNMEGAIPQDVLAALVPVFDRAVLKGTGQNLADAAMIHLWRGVIYRDEKTVRKAIDIFRSVVTVSPVGKEGLQADFSFHQHGPQQQFGNYGRGYLENCSTFIKLLSGTAFELSKAEQELIWNYFYNGTRWTLYKKQMDILACGRQITKTAPYGKYEQIYSYARNLGSAMKRQNEVKEFFNDDPALEGSNYFFRSDYLIHRRKDFYFSYRMCSERVISSETINKENLQGLYLGCGVMQYKFDGREYDNMPALWDWRRLPGLTAVYDDDSLFAYRDREKTNISPAVGAATDGKNTGVMMQCKTPKIIYAKSVSATDKTVVFNLNNIFNKTKYPVNTTIDSRLYRTPVEVTDLSGSRVYENGTHKLEKVTRIVHDKVAYTFLIPQDVILSIENKSVPWKSITVDAKGIEKGKVFTLYIDHTSAERSRENISYAVSPASEKLAVKIFFNDFGHVVKDENNIVFAYFFAPGKMEIPGVGTLSSDKKAAVMITDKTITASDVEQKNSVVNIELNKTVYKFDLPVGNYAGKSVTLSK